MATARRHTPGGSPERFVVLANPVSANARRIGRQVRELERTAVVPIEVIKTDRNSNRTRDALQKRLRDGDWLAVGAGDGTVNLAVEAAGSTPITPLAGGNANDIAHMLHTRQALRQPRHIIEQGRVVPVHPLYCHVTPPDGDTFTRLAAGYISLGASGRAAHEINQSRAHFLRRVPGAKKLYIGAQVCRGIIRSPEFKVQDDNGTYTRFENIFANGDRMAEHLRWQVALADPGAQELSIDDKRLLPVAKAIGQSLVGRLTGPTLPIGDERCFTVQDETYLQVDGEATLLAAGTSLKIGVSSQAFAAVTTRFAT